MEKFNVIKVLMFPSGRNAIKVKTGLLFNDACQELEQINEREKCALFQDVTDVNYELDMPSFIVVKNNLTIQYQVELDTFNEMAMLCKRLDTEKKLKTLQYQN